MVSLTFAKTRYKKAVALPLLLLSISSPTHSAIITVNDYKEFIGSHYSNCLIKTININSKSIQRFANKCKNKPAKTLRRSRSYFGKGFLDISCNENQKASFRYEVFGKVLTLKPTKHILRNQSLSNQNTSLTYSEIGKTRNNHIFDFNVINSVRAKRDLKPNAAISLNDIYAAPSINKNSEIDIVFENEAFHLSQKGKALEDGFIGDIINVENKQSLTIIRAQVMNSFSVKVL